MKNLYIILLILFAIGLSCEVYKHYQEKMDALSWSFTEELKERVEAREEVEEEVEVIAEITTKAEIKGYIRETAINYGVDPDLALKIAECESDFKNVCNYEYGCMGGIGIYQIVMGTFRETIERMVIERGGIFLTTFPDEGIAVHISGESPVVFSPHNIEDNINAALWLMSEGELWRWSQSQHNWK